MGGTIATYDELVARATSSADEPFTPYEYQRRVADAGLPELLSVPTGCGKTMAVVLGWLWRRRFHPDEAVRRATPRRLVYVLPQRVLVEQVAADVREWLGALGLAGEVGTYVLMGGEGREAGAWRLHPDADAVLVATQDMALSGALNRRFGDSRWLWPIDFGLLNNDCAWLFDEVQLMGPGLPTSRQLEGLRRAIGTAVSCTSTWMSATVPEGELATIDRPGVGTRLELGEEDRAGRLSVRLGATRRIEGVQAGDKKTYVRDVARAVADAHVPGTRTIAVFNTVKRAVEAKQALDALDTAPVVLLHSRFRPGDRQRHLDAVLADVDAEGRGVIVVSTQVLEAGVDVTSNTMFTEAALWSSVVQRAGRCNRDGKSAPARLLWALPPAAPPYDAGDVEATAARLRELEGGEHTTEELALLAPKSSAPVVHPTLRRRDLLELFDTLPDLSGNDLDVSRFIRDADDRELAVAWEELDEPAANHPLPPAEARCPVPIGDAADLVRLEPWRHDHVEGRWVPVRNRSDLRPGMVVLVGSRSGGYDPDIGWSPRSTRPVQPVTSIDAVAAGIGEDTDVGDDPVSVHRTRWVGLVEHLRDVEREALALDGLLQPSGLSAAQRRAAVIAGRLHDLGKAHPVFQRSLSETAADDTQRAAAAVAGPPWAKSAGDRRLRHERRHFRHELASALALLGDGHTALDGEEERDLIVYLVAAHHGRVRLGFRSMPGERPPTGMEGRVVALGIVDGEVLPSIEIPGESLPPIELDLSAMMLGSSADDAPSWSHRMLALRDRGDLGPFRLGFLEAIVRMADWRASATADDDAERLP